MSINFTKSALLGVLLLVGTVASGEEKRLANAQEQFEKLEAEYLREGFSKETYLEKADSLLIHFFSGGTYFERADLEELLSLFKEIAWSREDFHSNRINYFEHFMNNALMQGKGGEAIYFSEKVSAEITGSRDKKSLVELFTKCMFYIRNKNYAKAVALYRQEADNIDAYPEMLRSGEVSADESLKLMHLLSIIITPCTELGDTTGVAHTTTTAQRVADELLPMVENDRDKTSMIRILLWSMRFSQHVFLKDFDQAKAILVQVREMLDNEKDLSQYIAVPAEYNLLEWEILLSLEMKDNKNAALYIDRYTAMPSISDDHKSTIDIFMARLKANQGFFAEAYQIMVEAGKAKDKLYASMMNELDQLLYAHTEAEVNRVALQKSEEGKRKRTILVFIIVAAVISGMIPVYLWVQNEKKKTRKTVAALNQEANLQIAKLEEEKRHVIRKEQERIGLELHDDLSATMAAALYRLEHIASDLPAGEARAKVLDLQGIMEQVYQSVRDKSHSWHRGSENADGAYFREQITKMTSVLPDDRYTKEIEIENDVVAQLTVEQRVEIFRIIQESVTNILKHARASVVNLFLYKKGKEFVLHISDNGRGFDLDRAQRTGGLGLKTLGERAVRLDGRIEISSDKEGTAIEIIFKYPKYTSAAAMG